MKTLITTLCIVHQHPRILLGMKKRGFAAGEGNGFSGQGEGETEEMMPKWFHVDEIPFTQMWPDDLYWMPFFLKGMKFKGKFLFGENDAILEKELEEVAEI